MIEVNIVVCRAVSRQRLSKHIPAATDAHATIEGLLETVFSTWSVQGVIRTIEARIIQFEGNRRSERTSARKQRTSHY
jgi:hypothetical protein